MGAQGIHIFDSFSFSVNVIPLDSASIITLDCVVAFAVISSDRENSVVIAYIELDFVVVFASLHIA